MAAPQDDLTAQLTLHASAVAVADQAVLITGQSGAGKSSLALALMALGATLVADDRVILNWNEDSVLLSPPGAIAGKIEARGVGILACEYQSNVPLALVVTLDEMETDRLPPRRSKNLLGISVPLLHNTGTAHFAPAILQYLRGGRVE
ncbi:HPr kinase/phosphorylase [Pseudooceanicola sp. C21-150M6]|uniref:HPr kinase/phosphorylase n=1 Tax=Pseudooceanicola sp. C21-150M6 TaxID=3434355 RepID=UPI003D7F4AE9